MKKKMEGGKKCEDVVDETLSGPSAAAFLLLAFKVRIDYFFLAAAISHASECLR